MPGVRSREARHPDDGAPPPLEFPERRFSPMRNIGVRVAVAVLALVLTTAIVYLEQDCYQDRGEMAGLSWIDAFYYATVTLSTTGYGDITPVCESSRLLNALVITPLRFLFLIVLVGTTIEVLTRRTREQLRSNRWRKNVDKHTVVVGYGVKGRAAAHSPHRRRNPEDEHRRRVPRPQRRRRGDPRRLRGRGRRRTARGDPARRGDRDARPASSSRRTRTTPRSWSP